jgi:hypothetical protein
MILFVLPYDQTKINQGKEARQHLGAALDKVIK